MQAGKQKLTGLIRGIQERTTDIPAMMACWTPLNPRSQAYAQSGSALADAQSYAVGAAALLQEASTAGGLSANTALLSEMESTNHTSALESKDLLMGEPLPD